MDDVKSGPTGARAREVEAQQPPQRSRAAPNEVDFGVVVGVEHYPYYTSLSGAVDDARAFYDWLCEEDGGGLDPNNVTLILSNLEDETPEQDEIDRKLVALLDAAQACGGGHRLYFYFSGHGAAQSQDDVALLLTRWSKSLARLALSTKHYSSTLRDAGLFTEVAIFVDCCRTISASVIGREPLITREVKQLVGKTHTLIAYASEFGHPAHEVPQNVIWQGIFTKRLLSILRMEPNGIRADLLKDRLELGVETDARNHGLVQRAVVSGDLQDIGSFGRRGKLPVLTLRFIQRRGPVTLIGGHFELIAKHDAGEEPWQLAVPAGLYKLEGGGQEPILLDHNGREAPHDV